MTLRGYEALQEELKTLKSVTRPAIIQAIAEAREHGDLSENAEYHAAREQQSLTEGRIMELEDKTSRAEVIDPAKFAGDENIKFGATVTVADCDTDEEKIYQIVGELESDISKGLISLSSPLARALIGKTEGDAFELSAPGGTKDYEVVSVEYK
ncbi:transcription elongation factor GreA [Aestuariispira insulae]|uniref:Transcription elongation factor GreA n=2 Tax=Aestuariispira insulae TaxID=1461337 RepID=A0A3D9HET0_9PROT|nr:transcription elongation factor GreA [Aestuariispira insulae]